MNLSPSRIHDLISEDIVYVSVVFSTSKSFTENSEALITVSDYQTSPLLSKGIKTYSYKALKSLNLKVGDIIAVPVNNQQQIKAAFVLYIAEPDDFADSYENNGTAYDVRWVIGKIDINDYLRNQQSETEWLRQYKTMQSKSLRAQLLRAQFGDDVKMLAPRGNSSAVNGEIKNA